MFDILCLTDVNLQCKSDIKLADITISLRRVELANQVSRSVQFSLETYLEGFLPTQTSVPTSIGTTISAAHLESI
jgi:hypothetical protein